MARPTKYLRCQKMHVDLCQNDAFGEEGWIRAILLDGLVHHAAAGTLVSCRSRRMA